MSSAKRQSRNEKTIGNRSGKKGNVKKIRFTRDFICLETKNGLDIILRSFQYDESASEYTFPSNLSKDERAYIHQQAQNMGMKSHSSGKGNNRAITVKKVNLIEKGPSSKWMKLLPSTEEQIEDFLKKFPISPSDLKDVLPLEEKVFNVEKKGQDYHADCMGRCQPNIPPPLKCNKSQENRQKLPIMGHRSSILDLISKNQVVMISGDTGSGKTTQTPQYILEHFSDTQRPVRILCTQPRRIAAIAVAERVAAERGEPLGGTVGYQIRLENRTSSHTLLTFCTTGILLRTLMYMEDNLENVTHLIIDEVHERDRFCDFLLGIVRSRLPRFPHLRLILMSAALDVTVFSNYFESCPIIKVEGKCFPVSEFFLEDILAFTNYLGDVSSLLPAAYQLYQAEALKKLRKELNLAPKEPRKDHQMTIETQSFLDSLIQDCFIQADQRVFGKMISAIRNHIMPVDYHHSQTGLTPLMVASGRGRHDLVTDLLQLGANPSLKAGEWTASDLADQMKHSNVMGLLREAIETGESSSYTDLQKEGEHATALLQIYQERYSEEVVNVDLIISLLNFLEKSNMEGAVLIFLSGYEEIVTIRDRIVNHDRRLSSFDRFEVLMLHSSIQSGDQRRVFNRPPEGKRKVVLATNLAETSITIDDIVYVIDTGKVKVKSYDTLSGVSQLKAEWVSQASSLQRKGRAGRCRNGICFHLFSRNRYANFEKFQLPEIFRVPLEELCLQSKFLAPKDVSIAEFIGQVPEAPSPLAVKRAVQMLQMMDALDPWENVTDLGRLLLELPIEPRLGKMLLTATVLRCLDPVLSIVCCLSYRDPFILPTDDEEKKISAARKLELTGGSLSDHMAMLRAFTLWTNARHRGEHRKLCHEYFMSSATMEIIYQLRKQLTTQLFKSGFIGSLEELNGNAGNWAAIKASIVSGLYPQVARVNLSSGKLATRRDRSVRLHVTSALLGEKVDGSGGSQKKALSLLPSDWLVYQEMSRYGGVTSSVRCCTLVSPITLAIFGGHCRLPENSVRECRNTDEDHSDDDNDDIICQDLVSDDDYDLWSVDDLDQDLIELGEGLEDLDLAARFSESPLEYGIDEAAWGSKLKGKTFRKQDNSELCIDEWIHLRMARNSATRLFSLRQKWQALFSRRMRNPTALESPGDDETLTCLLSVLIQEEEASGLPAPPDFLGETRPPQQRCQEKSNGRYFRADGHPVTGGATGNNRRVRSNLSPRVSNGYDSVAQQYAERETAQARPSHGGMQNQKQRSKLFTTKGLTFPTSMNAEATRPTGIREREQATKPVGAVKLTSRPIINQRWVNDADSIRSRDWHLSNRPSQPEGDTPTTWTTTQQPRPGQLPTNAPVRFQLSRGANKRHPPVKNTFARTSIGHADPYTDLLDERQVVHLSQHRLQSSANRTSTDLAINDKPTAAAVTVRRGQQGAGHKEKKKQAD